MAQQEPQAPVLSQEGPVLALAEVIVKDGAAWRELTAQELPPMPEAMQRAPDFLKMSLFSQEGSHPGAPTSFPGRTWGGHWLAVTWWRDRQSLIDWHRTPPHKRIEHWAEAHEARLGLWIGFTGSFESVVLGEGAGAPKG